MTPSVFMAFRTFISMVLLGALVVLAGCSGSNRLQHRSAEDAYQQGMQRFEDEDYEEAIRYFRAVFSYGRANDWADDAQLQMARAHRNNGQFRLAATEYRRFLDLYRNDELVPTAEFERAMCFFELSPRYQLDQTDTQQALSLFQLFIDRYPNHELVPEAQEHISELREKLAHKKYEAATLYETRDMYRAAALTHEVVFDQYPETTWADDALLGAIRSYIEYSAQSVQQRQAERLEKAIENYNRLVQVFPNSSLLKEAEALYEEARERLDAIEERQSLAENG
jgi:outer membrane protein assembly factor BamD